MLIHQQFQKMCFFKDVSISGVFIRWQAVELRLWPERPHFQAVLDSILMLKGDNASELDM